MEISIVIPAYNEEARIGATISSILTYMVLKQHTFEIIVVDDGSTDQTPFLVNDFHDGRIRLISIGANRGKGFAVWKGLCKARFEVALFTDADLSTPIQELENLIPHLNHYDLIIGSRNLPTSVITKPQPFLRSRLGKSFPILAKLIAIPGIYDSQCGFKLFNRKAMAVITRYQTINDFGFDVEMLYLCQKAGLGIKEIGVHWGNAEGSKVRVIRDSIRMFFDLFRVRFNDIFGKYPVSMVHKSNDLPIPLHGGHF